jgi:hypothetical protein
MNPPQVFQLQDRAIPAEGREILETWTLKKQEGKRFFRIREMMVGVGIAGLAGLVGLVGPVGFLEIFLFGNANANTGGPLSTPLTWHPTNSVLVTGSGTVADPTPLRVELTQIQN